jgi:hypothetical protein
MCRPDSGYGGISLEFCDFYRCPWQRGRRHRHTSSSRLYIWTICMFLRDVSLTSLLFCFFCHWRAHAKKKKYLHCATHFYARSSPCGDRIKIAVRPSVRPSVRLTACAHEKTFLEIWYCVLRKPVHTFKFWLKSDENSVSAKTCICFCLVISNVAPEMFMFDTLFP